MSTTHSNNNLQALNDLLFETLRGVKEGKIEITKAKAVNEISATIINNAKVQLDAIKITKGMGKAGDIFSIKQLGEAPEKNDDTYELKRKFAQELGYDNVAAAIAEMTSWKFEKQYKEWRDAQAF